MVRRAAAQAGRLDTGAVRMALVVGGWLALVCGLQLYAWHTMLTPAELVDRLVGVCRTSPLGPLLFIGVAALSPLLLMPAALLGGVAGVCFGAGAGVAYTLVGCNLSALLMYALGRASHRADGRIAQLCARYGERLRRRPFVGVLLLRLSFLPYDPVNYVVGMLRVRPAVFLLANTLGSLPGVLAIVLAGSALGRSSGGLPAVDPALLAGAAAFLLICIGGALALRRARDLA